MFLSKEDLLEIRVEIHDSIAIEKIHPQAVVKYLKAYGWTRHKAHKEDIGIWRDGSEFYEIILPDNKNYVDWAARVRDAISTCATKERVSQLAVYNEMYEANL